METLCDVCRYLDFDELETYSGYAHHQTFSELQSCIECAFCEAVLKETESAGTTSDGPKVDDQQIRLRVFPSSIPLEESDFSNLLVYCTPNHDSNEQTPLAFFGLFLERTNNEMMNGKP